MRSDTISRRGLLWILLEHSFSLEIIYHRGCGMINSVNSIWGLIHSFVVLYVLISLFTSVTFTCCTITLVAYISYLLNCLLAYKNNVEIITLHFTFYFVFYVPPLRLFTSRLLYSLTVTSYFSIAYSNKSRYDYDILSMGLPLQIKPLVSLLSFTTWHVSALIRFERYSYWYWAFINLLMVVFILLFSVTTLTIMWNSFRLEMIWDRGWHKYLRKF